jgi:hypothetical protein
MQLNIFVYKLPKMEKLITLLVYSDKLGFYPSGQNKSYACDDIRVVGEFVYQYTDDVFDPTCHNILFRQGDTASKTDTPVVRLLKIKVKNEWVYVLSSKGQLGDICQNCCTTTNAAPVVSLAVDNATPTVGTLITFTATATDDGSIAKVEFWDGDTLISSDSSNPYQLATSTLVKGTYYIVAKAIDNLGKSTYSNWVKVVVS